MTDQPHPPRRGHGPDSAPLGEELDGLLNARADGELAPDAAARLAQALEREPMQLRAAAWEGDLARLQELLQPDVSDAEAVIGRVLERLAPELSASPSAAPALAHAPLWRWLAIPLAAAAGFAAALVLMPPRETILVREVRVPVAVPTDAPSPHAVPLGRIALATGALEVRVRDRAGWEVATPGTPLLPGMRVRTAPDRKATLALTDGSEIRLNAGTELACSGARQLILATGELWAHVANDRNAPFLVTTPNAKVTVTGTEISLAATAESTRLVVHSGRAQLADLAGREVDVAPRHEAAVQGDRLGDPVRAYQLERGLRWMVELLYLKGRDDPELARTVDALLAGMGSAKMKHLSEVEIRGLGQACALPLAKHLASSMGQHVDEAARRQTAARILADIAGVDVLPELVALIADPDAEVRRQAACGVCRLRGGMSAKQLERELARWAEPDEALREAHRIELLRALAPLMGEPRGGSGGKH